MQFQIPPLVSLDAVRKGPDENDPVQWNDVSMKRQMFLLVTGERNSKMNGYLSQIRSRHPNTRTALEQLVLTVQTIAEVNHDQPCAYHEPCPAGRWSYKPFAVGLLVAVVVIVILLLFQLSRRGWRLR